MLVDDLAERGELDERRLHRADRDAQDEIGGAALAAGAVVDAAHVAVEARASAERPLRRRRQVARPSASAPTRRAGRGRRRGDGPRRSPRRRSSRTCETERPAGSAVSTLDCSSVNGSVWLPAWPAAWCVAASRSRPGRSRAPPRPLRRPRPAARHERPAPPGQLAPARRRGRSGGRAASSRHARAELGRGGDPRSRGSASMIALVVRLRHLRSSSLRASSAPGSGGSSRLWRRSRARARRVSLSRSSSTRSAITSRSPADSVGERALERRRQAAEEPSSTSTRLVQRVGALAAAAALLGAEVVERGRARELAEPGAWRLPRLGSKRRQLAQRLLERLGGQVLGDARGRA